MRAISVDEMYSIHGGDLVAGITGVSAGLRLLTVSGALVASFEAGYTVGTYIDSATGLSEAAADLMAKITFESEIQDCKGIDQ